MLEVCGVGEEGEGGRKGEVVGVGIGRGLW